MDKLRVKRKGKRKPNKQERQRIRAEKAEIFEYGFNHGFQMGYAQGQKDAKTGGN